MLAVIVGILGVAALLRGAFAPADAVAISAATLLAAALSARFGWLGQASAVLPRLVQHLSQTPARLRAKGAGGARLASAAISGDVTIAPALIQAPWPETNPVARARTAAKAGAAPGAMPVALRDGHMLIHVLDEDRYEVRARTGRHGA